MRRGMSRFSTTSPGRKAHRAGQGARRRRAGPGRLRQWWWPGITRDRLAATTRSSAPCAIPRLPELAAAKRTTRSAAAVDLWRPHLDGRRGRDRQCPDGTVPLARDARRGCAASRRVILGFPVGFVGAAEAKAGARRLSASGLAFMYLARPARRQRDRRRRGQCSRRRPVRCPWLAVIGIGEDGLAGLSPAARALIETAEMLVGGAAPLGDGAARRGRAPPYGSARSPTRSTLSRHNRGAGWRCWRAATRCGTASAPFSLRRFPPRGNDDPAAAGRLQPRRRSARLAARRLRGFSLHAPPARHPAPAPRRPVARILALSEDGGHPRGGRGLLDRLGWGPSRLTVFEHLGGAAETNIGRRGADWGERRVPDLNTIAIECVAGPGPAPLSRLAGLPDDAFEHDGQLTKREVRAVTLRALAPLPGEMLWDIGAGCGSIAIEWLRAGEVPRRRGRARSGRGGDDRAQCRCARRAGIADRCRQPRRRRFDGLPAPGRDLCRRRDRAPGVLPALWAALRPGGRLVANVVTTEGEARLLDWQPDTAGALTRHRGQPRRAAGCASCLAATRHRDPIALTKPV